MSGVIHGVARGPDGQPIAGARVAITQAPVAIPDVAALTNAAGAFSLAAPARGTYAIQCFADGFRPAGATVTVEAGERVAVEIRLTRE